MKKPIFIAIILGLSIVGYTQYPLLKPQNNGRPQEEIKSASADQKRQLLFAVVIDNAPETRPQFGLTEAEFVIETLAEGPATRYLAFFSDKQIEKIGPVRSARPYFLDWALGFSLPFVHSGGSREALLEIASNREIKDINEFAHENYFWRDKARRAPHNLFTSTELMKELIEKKEWSASTQSFPRSLPSTEIGGRESSGSQVKPGMTTEIVVNFSTPNFAVDYKYDAADNSYARFLAGKPLQDIKAKNIVVLHTTSSLIDKKLLTIDLETAGSGKAVVFRDGQVIQARWRKQGSTSPLELLYADGTQIELNQGQTWIEVLDQRGSLTWK